MTEVQHISLTEAFRILFSFAAPEQYISPTTFRERLIGVGIDISPPDVSRLMGELAQAGYLEYRKQGSRLGNYFLVEGVVPPEPEERDGPVVPERGDTASASTARSLGGSKSLRQMIMEARDGLWKRIMDARSYMKKPPADPFGSADSFTECLGPVFGRALEEALRTLDLVGDPLFGTVRRHYPALWACSQSLAHVHPNTKLPLTQARSAWKRIGAFPEVSGWGVRFPGDVVDKLAELAHANHGNLERALAQLAKNRELRDLCLEYALVFDEYRGNLQDDPLRSVTDRQKPPTEPATNNGKGGRDMSPSKFTWQYLQKKKGFAVLGYRTPDELRRDVKAHGGVAGRALTARKRQVTGDSEALIGPRVTGLVREFLISEGTEVVRGKDAKRSAEPVSAPASPPAHPVVVEPTQALTTSGSDDPVRAILESTLEAFRAEGLVPVPREVEQSAEVALVQLAFITLASQFRVQLLHHVLAAEVAWSRIKEFGLVDAFKEERDHNPMLCAGTHLLAAG
ncbi:MAG: hypothetical protein HYS45_03300, partial [Parcubacteria group bacterium]|nr:hypothetical protein [Parcubacteria group bacterium]